MTLVVAKIIDDEIQVISDTRITDLYLGPQSPLEGQLKTIILNPLTVLSFSGLPSYAEEVLNSYYNQEIFNLRDLLIKCLDINKKSQNLTHFIISAYDLNKPFLYKIFNYKIEKDIKNAWIGDKEGFSKYQEAFHSLRNVSEFYKMEESFNKIIEDEKLETIGDFNIRVKNEIDANTKSLKFFNYQINRIELLGPYELEKVGDNNFLIKTVDASKGGYGISYLRSFNPYKPAFGIFFYVGKFGILFFPEKKRLNGEIFKDLESGEEFANQIKFKYGIDIQGIIINKNNSFTVINTAL
ncbi:hypothetical protein [Elizabethkingia miricola]|uniref:hypothetical protein n=1 Tax=Elizabethkingia miricola TaxID=172045 RepID=UPI000999F094|nr:hypothetical protein [Elizabethkingia miricola]OPC36848.1 hypothetical protein BAX99_17775 [Elizabethkingia miricola]